MDFILQDIRFAWLMIRRRPLLASAVILTLGLGIGANAAIFRAFSVTFLHPLPFADEERLVRIYASTPERDANLSPRPDVFLALRDKARSFSGIAGQRFNDFTIVLEGTDPLRVPGIEVSEDWASILGVRPILGRTFNSSEQRQGRDSDVVLISHHAWQSRFGADPMIIGRPITIDGRPASIIGVMPPRLRFPYESEVWVPVRFDRDLESTWGLNIVARLRGPVRHEEMAAELRRLTGDLPEMSGYPGLTLTGIPLRQVLIDDDAPLLVAVSITVLFLLVLVTVNVANLLVADSLARRRELAIRTALGAGLRRHLRQALTEGLSLSLAGGLLGLLVAWMSTSLLAFLVPGDFAYVLDQVPFDGRVFAFTLAVSVVAGIGFGAIPVLRLARTDPSQALSGGPRTTEGPATLRLTAILTAFQLGLALVLLAGAHGMMRDFERRITQDLGYDPDGVVTMDLSLPASDYATADQKEAFFDEVVDRLSALPGANAVGTVNIFPAAGEGTVLTGIEAEGVETREDAPIRAHLRLMHGDLLNAMNLRLLRGRFPTPTELRAGDRVAVVSRALAMRLWGDENPLGRQVRASRDENAPWMTVVGVIDDVSEFYADTNRSIWQPVKLSSELPITSQMSVVVETNGDPALLAAELRNAIREIDPGLAVSDIATASELYRRSLDGRDSARTLTGAFAILGLVIATIGVYASMAFSMTRRSREIAIRKALGASKLSIARHFMKRSGSVIAAGLGGGVIGATALGTSWGDAVFEKSSLLAAVPSMALAAGILGAVALIASWLPLSKAIRTDASTVLRAE